MSPDFLARVNWNDSGESKVRTYAYIGGVAACVAVGGYYAYVNACEKAATAQKEAKAARLLGRGRSLTGLVAAEKFKKHVKKWQSMATTKNWARTVDLYDDAFRTPTTYEEVMELVKTHKKCKAAGALHSCAPVAKNDECMISCLRLNRVLEVDEDKMTARVQAGIKIYALMQHLALHGLAIPTTGTVAVQTLGGAISTGMWSMRLLGTHGGSLFKTGIHAYCLEYKLVKHDGELITIKKGDPDFEFICPSMGTMGILVEIVIQCIPRYRLEAELKKMRLVDLMGVWFNITSKNTFTRFMYYPSLDQATVWTANEVPLKDEHDPRCPVPCDYFPYETSAEQIPFWLFINFKQSLSIQTMKRFHSVINFLEGICCRVSNFFTLRRLKKYEGWYEQVLLLSRDVWIRHADMEMAFDYKDSVSVLAALREFFKDHVCPYYAVEIRVTKKDSCALSQSGERDTMYIDFQARSSCYIDYFGALEEHLRPFNFRLHWAKGCITTTGKDVRHLYSRWDEFTAKMKEMDPTGKFYNDHLDRWFGDRADSKMRELVTKDMLRFKKKYFEDKEQFS